MQVPESWLRAFCDPELDSAHIAERLTMAGLEIEDMRTAAPAFSGVVVARVRDVQPHPKADRLRVCQVDIGADAPLQIVCGAPNVAAGMTVPCARVGAVLPPADEDGEPLRIGPATMRGVTSHGMLCSARELGLSGDHSGLLALDDALTPGDDLRRALDLDETVFTVKLTPNLGHCMSVYGIARELAAVSGAPLRAPRFDTVEPAIDAHLPVRVHAPDLCGRFSGRVIRGVDARAPTPAWMRARLERAGQRSISALVDISNYVMLELGRPTHVFDLDRIDGGLDVRWGRSGETLELLNGQTVAVDESVGVIADGRGLESLAGIMGGEATAVTLDTRNVYVEAAFWWPDAIRGRARGFNFTTDAAQRFERGVDAASTVEHLDYISALIQRVCGGQAGPVHDVAPNLPQRAPVRMRVARCEKVIGIAIGAPRMAEVFTRLGLEHRLDDGVFTVTPPSWRFDLEIEEDLIEEVARIHGYENIPTLPPRAALAPLPAREGWRSTHALRDHAAARGYQETINFSFAEPQWERDLAGNAAPIALLNPIASQASVMRSTLFGGLLHTLRANLAHKARRVRLFELGRVFVRDATREADADGPGGLRQPMRIGGLAYGPALPTGWGAPDRAVDFFDVKADVEALCAGCGELRFEPAAHPALHPGRSARVRLDGRDVGVLGELHPRWVQRDALAQAPVLFELDAVALQHQALPQPRAVPRTPAMLRDLALVLDATVPAATLLDAVARCVAADPRCAIVCATEVFDAFALRDDAARRSLGLRLTLQGDDTLTDAQAEAACAGVVEALRRELGAELRH